MPLYLAAYDQVTSSALGGPVARERVWPGRAEDATAYLSRCLRQPLHLINICPAERELHVAWEAFNAWVDETSGQMFLTPSQRDMHDFLLDAEDVIECCRMVDDISAEMLVQYSGVLATEKTAFASADVLRSPHACEAVVAV